MRPRVVVADSQALVLEAFARLLEPELEVVGRATDGVRLVEAALRLRPELVLTDVSLPLLGGLAAACRLRDELPSTRVAFLAAHEDAQVAAEAFRAGAMGYVLRSASPRELTRALRAVLRGERWLSPALAGGRPDALPSVTEVTVAFHKYQAMEALSVTSSAQLVRLAVESRLLAVGWN